MVASPERTKITAALSTNFHSEWPALGKAAAPQFFCSIMNYVAIALQKQKQTKESRSHSETRRKSVMWALQRWHKEREGESFQCTPVQNYSSQSPKDCTVCSLLSSNSTVTQVTAMPNLGTCANKMQDVQIKCSSPVAQWLKRKLNILKEDFLNPLWTLDHNIGSCHVFRVLTQHQKNYYGKQCTPLLTGQEASVDPQWTGKAIVKVAFSLRMVGCLRRGFESLTMGMFKKDFTHTPLVQP